MSDVMFLGVGDVGPVHGPADGFPIERYTELVRPTLAKADLRFGNCERQYSTRGVVNDESPHGRQPPEMARIFDDCGFDVLSLANNHMYDYGPEALLDTRALMVDKGFKVTGAGKDLQEARQPAIIDVKGVTVGFLAYCSFFPPAAPAAFGKPGIATLRVTAEAECRGPHEPARVRTAPDADDLRMLLADVEALREKVDVVVLSLHWGVTWVPRVIADYQVIVGHACIDAGADLILGHHAHLPKAIEIYKGKAIFYSLSNFCMTKAFPAKNWSEPAWAHGALRNHTDLDPDYPFLPYGKEAKRSLVVKAMMSRKGISEVSWLPAMIDKSYRPEILRANDPRFGDMVNYMTWASDGMDYRFAVKGDEVVVHNG